MNKHIVVGKTSNDFSSAMLTLPQNREEVIRPFAKAVGAEVISMLWLNHPDMHVCLHLTAPSDEAVSAMCGIVRSSGNFDKLDWFRAFDSQEFKEVFETAPEAMTTYVSAMAVTGLK